MQKSGGFRRLILHQQYLRIECQEMMGAFYKTS